MAHSLSARKRNRQNIKSRARNRWWKRRFRVSIKDFLETVLHGSIPDSESKYRALSKLLDQVAAKGAIHKNAAARYKSRLAARLNAKRSAA